MLSNQLRKELIRRRVDLLQQCFPGCSVSEPKYGLNGELKEVAQRAQGTDWVLDCLDSAGFLITLPKQAREQGVYANVTLELYLTEEPFGIVIMHKMLQQKLHMALRFPHAHPKPPVQVREPRFGALRHRLLLVEGLGMFCTG